MYADRHARRMKLDPGSLGLSAAMVSLMIGGLIFSAPDFVTTITKPFVVKSYPVRPTPEPEPLPKPKDPVRETKQTVAPFIPKQVVPTQSTSEIKFTSQPDIVTPTYEGTGPGVVVEPVKPTPVIVGPGINPRFNYQPDYPANERRLGHEGRVVVRVLVGTDGRVKQVEKVSAASDSFFEATRRRALEKWRLTPGTKDGMPIEAWRTMSVSFVMNDE